MLPLDIFDVALRFLGGTGPSLLSAAVTDGISPAASGARALGRVFDASLGRVCTTLTMAALGATPELVLLPLALPTAVCRTMMEERLRGSAGSA